MADVQDEDALDDDQWLYGDDKGEGKEDGEINDKTNDQSTEQENGEGDASTKEGGDEAAEKEGADKEKENEGDDQGEKDKDGEKGDDDSSDEDDLTITIGVLKTQPDIIQAPTAPHPARFQPKPSTQTGLKDDDFTSPGKVNGVSITEYNLQDLEDKPWRKPGADISDYFNYGFNEETWFKYCERQKRMRMSESGAGLGGLGISTGVNKPFGHVPNSIPVTIINDNSKYGGSGPQRKAGPPPRSRPLGQIDVIASGQAKPNTIQVMTADRREYSNKILSGPPPNMSSGPPGYDDMEFGGNPYGESFYVGESYYGGGGNFSTPPPWPPGGVGPPPPMDHGPNWSDNPPPIPVPPPAVTPVSAAPGYFDQDSMTGPPPPSEPEEERHRSRRSHRSRSRSPSRHRHSGSRHARSRSRSPSHRHKRKKSKRERDAE